MRPHDEGCVSSIIVNQRPCAQDGPEHTLTLIRGVYSMELRGGDEGAANHQSDRDDKPYCELNSDGKSRQYHQSLRGQTSFGFVRLIG
jgi:hypothetical protein